MATVRSAAVAGMFYPADRAELAATVRDLLQDVEQPAVAGKAMIVPHAGFVYSGPTAALGYASLAGARDRVSRVVLLGPCHRVALRGLALPGSDYFDTPLGRIGVDSELAQRVSKLPYVVTSVAAHAEEHSLEVQLPFLQGVLPTAAIVPLAVGRATPDEVAAVLDEVWGGDETLIVISSDLSHYLPEAEAIVRDKQTIDQILRLDGPLEYDQACGAGPINGLLLVAARRRMSARLLGRSTSADTIGSRHRVVGYAAIAFDESV